MALVRAIARAACAAIMLWSGAAFARDAPQTVQPALYVVRDADSTLYLFGTVHVRPNGADWGDAAVRAAIESSDEVWTEIDISADADARAQALAQRLSAAPAGHPLSSWLQPDEVARLTALTRRLGISAAQLEPLRPWAAGLTLTLIPLMQAGYDPQSGVDRSVDAYAEARGKHMRSFETIEEQLGFLANLPPELQRQMLLEAINESEEGPALLGELSSAWERGDVEQLDRLVVQDTRDNYPELYEVLFRGRNAAWVEVLAREMAGVGADFVAVGAGHLVGDEGLVAQLRARGLSVERVAPH